jgi:pilus assembly protein Flp/PilA
MRRLLKKFFKNDSGATAIEYALIAMGISIVIVSAVNGVGTASVPSLASSAPR